MGEWKEYKFSEFVLVNPKVNFEQKNEIPFVEMKDIEPNNKFCTNSSYRKLGGGSRFENGDTLFARITPCLENGKIAQVRNLLGGKGLGSTEFHVLRGKKDISFSDFIYYLSRWKEVRDFAEINLHGTSGRQRFPSDAFKELDLYLPPLPEQERIAEVLSSLDDKIDLLHRQNKTLEEMAETMFRQLFVVEAEESIEEISLSDISKHVKKSINPSKIPEQLFKHYSLPSFDNGRNPEIQFGREILSNKYQISPGQILISKLNPRTPRVWFINSCDNHSICSTEFQVYEPIKKEYTEFIYCLLKSNDTRDILSGASSGTSGSHQRVNPEDINNLSIKKPIADNLNKFHQIVSVWLSKIDSNVVQITKLSNLRDTLLPKLMIGQITYSN